MKLFICSTKKKQRKFIQKLIDPKLNKSVFRCGTFQGYRRERWNSHQNSSLHWNQLQGRHIDLHGLVCPIRDKLSIRTSQHQRPIDYQFRSNIRRMKAGRVTCRYRCPCNIDPFLKMANMYCNRCSRRLYLEYTFRDSGIDLDLHIRI